MVAWGPYGTADDCVVTRSVPTHTISIF